jgi:hypothetical protein
MEGCGNRFSCGNLLKKLKMFPLTSQYLLSSLMFTAEKQTFSPQTLSITIQTPDKENLPTEIKIVADNLRKFKTVLKKFLYIGRIF